MGVLTQQHIERVHHYAPLHYLPFIGRSKSLLCKPSLLAAGFAQDHLRSMSREHDVERGFGAYTHLTLEPGIAPAAVELGKEALPTLSR